MWRAFAWIVSISSVAAILRQHESEDLIASELGVSHKSERHQFHALQQSTKEVQRLFTELKGRAARRTFQQRATAFQKYADTSLAQVHALDATLTGKWGGFGGGGGASDGATDGSEDVACVFADGMCHVHPGWAKAKANSLEDNSPMKKLVNHIIECASKTDKATCAATVDCSWMTELNPGGECSFDEPSGDLLAASMQEVICGVDACSAEACGEFVAHAAKQAGEAGKCDGNDPCEAPCQKQTAELPDASGVCREIEKCVGEPEPTTSLCVLGNDGYQTAWDACTLEAGDITKTWDHAKAQQHNDCMKKTCPQSELDIVYSTWNCNSKMEDMSGCQAEEDCKVLSVDVAEYEIDGAKITKVCVPDLAKIIDRHMTAKCAYKTIMEATFECGMSAGNPEDCPETCDIEEETKCTWSSESNKHEPLTRKNCEVSEDRIFTQLAALGGTNAAVDIVAKQSQCAKMANEASCGEAAKVAEASDR